MPIQKLHIGLPFRDFTQLFSDTLDEEREVQAVPSPALGRQGNHCVRSPHLETIIILLLGGAVVLCSQGTHDGWQK